MKLYLDTCVISGIAKQDLRDEEACAMAELLSLYSRGELSLVTSPVARAELDQIPAKYRGIHFQALEVLRKIEAVDYLVLNLGPLRIFPVKRHSVYEALRNLLRDDEDAKHLYQAHRHEVSFFLTVDCRTILSKAVEVEEVCRVRPVLPSTFLASRRECANRLKGLGPIC